ncbi:MAG: hypothetical protein DRG78_05155 [Epsilonproteobacteria bacterium]|nr:MAG: hypothetical protein DRG78_05155 [Campylobacterota bacterium]
MKQILTIKEYVEESGIGKSQIYNLIKNKKLKSIKVDGNLSIIVEKELEKVVEIEIEESPLNRYLEVEYNRKWYKKTTIKRLLIILSILILLSSSIFLLIENLIMKEYPEIKIHEVIKYRHATRKQVQKIVDENFAMIQQDGNFTRTYLLLEKSLMNNKSPFLYRYFGE